MYQSVEELVNDALEKNVPISELMVQQEMLTSHRSRQDIW